MDYAIVRKIIRDCLRIDEVRYGKTKVLTLAHDNDRSLLYKGKYYSPLVDTIEDELRVAGIRCVSVSRIISTIKGDAAYGNVISPEGSFARALVTKRLKGVLQRGRYSYSRMEENIWGRILDETGARKVIGILPSRELCVACRKRGIWVADVQHGVIAETHPWYGEKFRACDPVEYLPHEFLNWDLGSRQVIAKWAEPKGVVTRVIGNRWVARFMRRDPEDQLVNELFADYRARQPAAPDKKVILVALSWGEFNIPNGFIADGLQEVIRATSDRYRWLIRLHPNQLKGFATHESTKFYKYFSENLAGHAEWELPTRFPLPVVLAGIDLHISWMSSVCIEAAQMGIRSALLNPRLRAADAIGDYYEYYRGRGMVDLVQETSSEITAWIEKNIARRHPPEDYEEGNREYRRLISFLAA